MPMFLECLNDSNLTPQFLIYKYYTDLTQLLSALVLQKCSNDIGTLIQKTHYSRLLGKLLTGVLFITIKKGEISF